MFTGIIKAMGQVTEQRNGHLTLRAPLTGIHQGDSLAVHGVCLTVTGRRQIRDRMTQLTFDLSPETRRSTNLGKLAAGRWVNLERPLALSDRLGGHLVQGHVDGTGTIQEIHPQANAWRYTIRAPRKLLSYLVPKGSVAIDGISFTVVEVRPSAFTVSVIPYTAHHTALRDASIGDAVNLEVDLIAKYVRRYLRGPAAHIHALR